MKFQPERLEGANTISRVEPHCIWVQSEPHAASVLVPWSGPVQAWPVADRAGLTEAHFEQLLAFEPELVIFGSGAHLRFISPALYRPLISRGIGMETMDTGAACRTFNVLLHEGRKVLAALLIDMQMPKS